MCIHYSSIFLAYLNHCFLNMNTYLIIQSATDVNEV